MQELTRQERNSTIGTPDLEDLAFKGFEDPSTLTLEEIRMICAAVVMESIGQRRRASIKLAS